MLSEAPVGPPSPPRITHTAATPQDSPNTTADLAVKESNKIRPNEPSYCSAVSIDSIDSSNVGISISSSFLPLPFLSYPPLPIPPACLSFKCKNFLQSSQWSAPRLLKPSNNYNLTKNNLSNSSQPSLGKGVTTASAKDGIPQQ